MSPVASYLLQTLLTLVVVVAVGGVLIVAGRRAGMGRAVGPMRLVGQLPLDARRALYLVRVGSRVLVVGASEGGLTRLAELGGDELGVDDAAPPPSLFAHLFARAGKRDATDDGREAAPSEERPPS